MLKRFRCRGCGCELLLTGGNADVRCDPCWTAYRLLNVGNKYKWGKIASGAAAAHRAVARAVRSGDLPRPATLSCADCNGTAVEYDHRDYNQPLVVEAVCRSCNLLRGKAVPLRLAA